MCGMRVSLPIRPPSGRPLLVGALHEPPSGARGSYRLLALSKGAATFAGMCRVKRFRHGPAPRRKVAETCNIFQ
jgi:hypothetical protein